MLMSRKMKTNVEQAHLKVLSTCQYKLKWVCRVKLYTCEWA